MPSAYKWRPLLAGALEHSVNHVTIRRNEHRASLTPLETACTCARGNRGNRLKQRGHFAQRYDEYQALDDENKAQVDQEMKGEENKVVEQESVAILVDWRRYYPNQFLEDGLLFMNPPTPIEVDSPPNSPAWPVFPSPKMSRVRYGADGAPKNAGPRPFSPLRPTQRPGAWYLFRHSLPLSPLRPPPHPYPRRVPIENRW